MHKKYLLVAAALVGITGIIAGTVYAWNSQSSDVGRPISTAIPGEIRYKIIGDSMAPTLLNGDSILVTKNAAEIARGQLVVLRDPGDQSKLFCRRVVAVAGDRVVMKYYSNVKITTVYSRMQPEGVAFPADIVPNGDAYGEYTTNVAPDTFYVVGDNSVPGASYDSDEWGLLPRADVVGVVLSQTSSSSKTISSAY
jgi:signal peptidase I